MKDEEVEQGKVRMEASTYKYALFWWMSEAPAEPLGSS